MTDRPIIFSAPMIRALLDGRKTQTRRVISTRGQANLFNGNWTDEYVLHHENDEWRARHVQFAPGDRLWIKETWRPSISAADPWHVAVLYPHDGKVKHWNWSSDADFGDWTIPMAAAKGNVTPLFMPRWASRLTLTVTDVRVQRLQEISADDAVAEGMARFDPANMSEDESGPVWRFGELWNSLHGPDAWAANPWVVAISFTVQNGNIDQIGGAA